MFSGAFAPLLNKLGIITSTTGSFRNDVVNGLFCEIGANTNSYAATPIIATARIAIIARAARSVFNSSKPFDNALNTGELK